MTTQQEIKAKVEEINNEHKRATEEITMQEVQTQTSDWLKQEYDSVLETEFVGEKLESLKIEENRVTCFEVDLTEPFGEYVDPINDVIKKIIKVNHEGTKKNFWINVKNPVYSQIVKQCYEGDVAFKIMRTGQQAETRYHLIPGDAN
jgi:hypothetical protein